MNIRWFIAILYVVVLLVTAVLSSCEHTFPYDKLNNYWSLDWIEYKGEVNQRGVACEYDECDNVMFGFAYHIVLVEDISHIFAKHDIILEHSDFIKLDYSVYDDTQLASQLLDYGMESVVSWFKVNYPGRNKMTLSSSRLTMQFRKR